MRVHEGSGNAHSAASVWEQPDEDVLTVMAKVCALLFISFSISLALSLSMYMYLYVSMSVSLSDTLFPFLLWGRGSQPGGFAHRYGQVLRSAFFGGGKA